MKITTKTILLSIVILSFTASCKKESKDDSNNSTPTVASGYTAAEINGKSWTSEKTKTYIKTAKSILGFDTFPGCEARLSGDTILFAATRFSDTSLILARIVLNKDRAGSYSGKTTFSAPTDVLGMLYLPKLDETEAFTSVTLYTTNYNFTINKWDAVNKKFSGVFSFNMVSGFGLPGINVTRGIFEDVNFVID